MSDIMFSGGACNRASTRLSRALMSAFLLVLALQSGCGHNQRFSAPEQLYHRVWAETANRIYDPATLGDWGKWERKFDGRLNTSDKAATAINEMLGSIHDQYTYFMDSIDVSSKKRQSRGKTLDSGILFYQRVDELDQLVKAPDGRTLPACSDDGYPIVEEITPGSPAEESGIKSGDQLVSIDRREAKNQSIHELIRQLRAPAGSSIAVNIRRENGRRDTVNLLIVARATQDVSSKRLADGVCYLRLYSFHHRQAGELFRQEMEKLADCKGWVLDLRDNPGGYIDQAIAIASLFLDCGIVVTERERKAGGYERRVYRLTSDQLAEDTTDETTGKTATQWSKRVPNASGYSPLVLLIDGETASSAEILTGALKDNGRATLVGTRTFGKGIGQRDCDMPDSTALHITVLRFFTPNGHWLGDGGNSQSHGIQPDITVEATDDIQPGTDNDNQLKKALEMLRVERWDPK